MPEAVVTWFNNAEKSIVERIHAVQKVHTNLVLGYKRDFGKYGKTDAHCYAAILCGICFVPD